MTKKNKLMIATAIATVFAVMPAEAAKKRVASADDAREQCIKLAMDRVNSLGPAATNAEKNASGLDVYRSCAASKGIR